MFMIKAPADLVTQELPSLSDEPVSRFLPMAEGTEGNKEQTLCLQCGRTG